MKSTTLTCITAITLYAALAIPVWLVAQEQQQQPAGEPPHYNVTDLGTLGGTFGQAFGINNKGEVVGWSTLPGDTVTHAFLWRKGVMADLGAFGGTVSAAFSISERSEVVGTSETSAPDPLGEDFCGFGDHLICLPFLWQGGVMTQLQTLGGHNGIAVHINDRGRVFGFAENSTPDSTCVPPQVLHFEPVIWNKTNVEQLPVFSGDVDGIAGGFNDAGQATIPTGNCTGIGPPDGHDSFYQHGTLTDLGSFGGNPIAANNMNNKGQVVGVTSGPSGALIEAVLWQHGVASGLGFLPGDIESFGNAINDNAQVVGQSCDATGNCRGFLWRNGVITDLNTLVPAGTDYTFFDPGAINSRGEIVGLAMQNSTGEFRAFLLTPCGEGDAGCEDSVASATRQSSPAPPALSGRSMPDRLRARRYHGLRTAVTSGPIVSLSPTHLNFGVCLVGTTVCVSGVTLTNSGTAPLSIASIVPSGGFIETNMCGSSLAAGASCTISVTFAPSQRGLRTGTLSLTDNAPGSPQSVSLKGIGTVVELVPPRFSGPCCSVTITLTNVGKGVLSISGITFTTPSPYWMETNTCGSSVGAGKSCTINVYYVSPATLRSNTLSIADDGGGSPQNVFVTFN